MCDVNNLSEAAEGLLIAPTCVPALEHGIRSAEIWNFLQIWGDSHPSDLHGRVLPANSMMIICYTLHPITHSTASMQK